MAESSPFTPSIQHGIRLACLLIEEGTQAVRKIFDGLVKPDLPTMLSLKKAEMEKYKKGSKQYPRLLNNAQWRMLYTDCYGSDKFDLSLLILLINILCNADAPKETGNWVDPPKETDLSRGADLVRLRLIRNTIYGHISTVGYENAEFIHEWEKLAGILERLGVDRKHISRWKESPLAERRLKKYQEDLALLVVNDRLATEEMIYRLEKMIHDNTNTLKEIREKQIEECAKIQHMISNSDSQKLCIARLKKLIQSLDVRDALATISQRWAVVEEKIECVKVTTETTLCQVHEIKEDMKNSRIVTTTIKEPETFNLLEEYMSSCIDSYKVLVCNAPDHGTITRSDLTELCKHLGSVPWDLVIDLDHESRTNGIYDDTVKVLTQHKSFQVITYDKTRNIASSEQKSNILGQKAIWVLANGCVEARCKPILDKFGGKAKIPMTNMLCDILNQSSSPKSLFVMILSQSKVAEDAMKETVTMILEVIQNCDDIVAEESCVFAHICLGGNADTSLLEKIDPKFDKVSLSASHRELARCLERMYPTPDSQKKYFFPGVSGETFLWQSDVTALSPSMELFHRDIGDQDFTDMDPAKIEAKMSEIRLEFHKGNPITPEAIRINSKQQVFVRRNEMDETLERLEKKMMKTRWSERENHPFYIVHEASGGGTTVATVVLFELRNKYPSVKILKIDDCLYHGLQVLYKLSKKVILVMIDNDDIQRSDINTLSKRLENDKIKVQLLATRRVYTTETDPELDSSLSGNDQIYVSGALDSTHAAAFLKLFKGYKYIQEAKRIFPIGLQAFLTDHFKLDSHIKLCMKHTTQTQNLLLRLVCMVAKYGQYRLSIRLAQAILQVSPGDMYGHITEALGYANDFLLFSREGEIKLASTCVKDLILQCAFGPDIKGHWIGELIKDIHELISRLKDHTTDLSDIVYHVFIKREKELDQHEIHWSPFIQNMMDCFPEATFVADQLHGTIEKLEGTKVHPHMQALLARFYMHELKAPKRSIALIRAALGLEQGETIESSSVADTHLLTTYGSLYRERVHRERVQANLSLAREYLEEAINACQLAERVSYSSFSQIKNKHNAVPFIQEARARVYLLQRYLSVQCKSDRKAFRKYLDNAETDKFIRTCELEAYKALDNIDFLRSQDKLHDDSNRTITAAQKVRFDLLLLNVDMPNVQKQISALPENVPCDVGSLIRSPANKSQRRKYWEELEERELVFIIEETIKRLPFYIVLRSNYFDIITAMIHIRNRGQNAKYDKYNIKYAAECANKWAKYHPNDHRAHFMLGVLKFIIALGDETEVAGVADHFKECSRICLELKSTPAFRLMRYYIGPGAGLAKLVPSELQARREKDSLEVFTGRLVAKHFVTISEFPEDIKAYVIMPENVISRHEQEPRLRFNLAFAHDGVKAVNAEYLSQFHDTESD